MNSLVEAWTGGVIPAVPVPFRADNTINDELLGQYVAWMATKRVAAVAVGVHTGRGLHLSEAQHTTVVDLWKKCGHDLVFGVGVPAAMELPTDPGARTDAAIRETVKMTKWAKREGAKAVLVYPPTAIRHLSDAQDRAVALHEAVAAVGVATIVFYLYEEAGGIDYTDASLERMLDIDGVVGVKLATLDRPDRFGEVVDLLVRHADRLCITGEDLFYGASIARGADAALIGMAAACTDRMIELFELHYAGDRGRFETLSSAVDVFANATFCDPVEGYVQRVLWALEGDGVLSGTALDPFAPSLDRDDRACVLDAVQALRSA